MRGKWFFYHEIHMKDPKVPFDIFEPYMSDENVTDINYNGKDLWIDHLNKGRLVVAEYLDEDAVMHACVLFSNLVNQHFNIQKPLLEADYDMFRISMLHPSVSGKLSLSIRKTPMFMRMKEENLVEEGYITQECLIFLKKCVMNKLNIMVSGLPGAGKTELIKFLTLFIDEKSRVISIEDSRELHYEYLHPKRDSVSLKVNEVFTYDKAIKASMRQRPNWLLVSEVRGKEVSDLLKSISTGTHLLSTIHAKCAEDIPKRMLYMMEDIDKSSEAFLGQLYDAIDLGIHVELQVTHEGMNRYIREIVAFKNQKAMMLYHHIDKPNLIKREMEVLF